MTALRSIKNQTYQIVFWQLMVVIVLAIVLFIFRGMQHGFSALLGGLAYWLPTLLFVWRVFARAQLRAAKQFIIVFFAGETVKLIFSAILFILIVKFLTVNVISVLIGYVCAIFAFWMVAMFFLSRQQGVGQ